MTIERCRAEIEGLHDRFAEWFTGTVERDGFDRIEAALAPEFDLVTPEGTRLERSSVLEWLRGEYGREAPGELDIAIEDVEVVERMGEYTLARYEEWETTPDDRTGRISTALFRADPDAPEGIAWVSLHETFIGTDE